MAKRISIINFKGGVGKTTLTFHLGAGLARFHKARVLLVDMDHQSSLSIPCLETDGWEQAAAEGLTTNAIFNKFVNKKLPGKEIIHKNRVRSKQYNYFTGYYPNMDVVPASLELDDTEIELTATHIGTGVGSEWDKRTLVCRWIEETGVDDDYDYILFDCAPATKIVTQNAIAASHGYVVPVVPEAVMERGTPHLHKMIEFGIDARLKDLADAGDRRWTMYVPDTRLIGLVVTRIQVAGGAVSGYTNDHTLHLESLKRQWKTKLLEPYVKQGTGVSDALAAGVPVYDRSADRNIGERGIDDQYRELTRKLKRRIDRS